MCVHPHVRVKDSLNLLGPLESANVTHSVGVSSFGRKQAQIPKSFVF
jgi:hypothetical protein